MQWLSNKRTSIKDCSLFSAVPSVFLHRKANKQGAGLAGRHSANCQWGIEVKCQCPAREEQRGGNRWSVRKDLSLSFSFLSVSSLSFVPQERSLQALHISPGFNSEIFIPIFWSRVNMSNCWRVDQGFVLFPLQNVNQGVASCHGDRLDGSRWNSSWQLFIWIELCRHQIWPRPSPCACHTLIFW